MSLDPYKILQPERLKYTSSSPFTPAFVKNNLSQSCNADELYATRVHGRKVLLDNPVKESRVKQERQAKKARKRKEQENKRLRLKRETEDRRIWKLDESQAK